MALDNNRRFNNYFYLILSVLLLFLVVFVWKKLDESNRYRVLVIHSFDKDYVWTDDFKRGLADGFKQNRVSVDLVPFYWEAAQTTDQTQRVAALNAWLEAQAVNPPDLIITCDDYATMSFLQTHHPLSRTIPTVFCGVDYMDMSLLKDYSNVTGFTDDPDFTACYELGRQLFGRVSDITVVADDDPYTGQVVIDDLRREYSLLPNLVLIKERFPEGVRMDTMAIERGVANPFYVHIERINSLNGRELKQVLYYRLYSICILARWDESYTNLAQLGTAPFLMVNNEGFGDGRLGGYMTPGYNQTLDAALVGGEILKGRPVHTIPITRSKQYPVFDWNQLVFWKIDLSSLPEGAIIPNEPFMTKYGHSVTVASLIGGAFVLLFLSLLVRLYRRESFYEKQSQLRLQKEQKELDITLNSLNEGVISFDTNGVVLQINRKAVYWLGLDASRSYTGSSVRDLLDVQEKNNQDYLQSLIEALAGSAEEKIKLEDNAFMVTAFNRTFPVSGSVCRLSFEGRPYGVVISFRDITTELTQKQELDLSMNTGHIFAWRFNQRKRNFLFDKVFFDTFNLPDDGSHTIDAERFMMAIHPEDEPMIRKVMEDMLAGRSESHSITCRMRYNGEGDYQWWKSYISLYPKSMAEGSYKYFGVWVNIDEFKQREEELTRLRDEAEESDQLKSVFLSNMSHEVRTPLNSIVGFSSILIENEDLPWESRKEFIDIINDNCRLLLNLINEILDISRIESGIYFREEPCNLIDIIREASAMCEDARPDTVSLVTEIPADAPLYVTGDTYRLIQLYTALLNNAYKFTERGEVTIGCRLGDTAGAVDLYVTDTGMGIAKENVDKIFNRFYKVDDFVQGGGLGLSIVQEIVKRMNGTVRVGSVVGKGSEFVIHLPGGGEAHEE